MYDVANWIQTNPGLFQRLFQSILAIIILIISGVLVSEKPKKQIPSKRILSAVLFVFATFIFLYANIPDLANVFTVWATLILAGVAILSFEESKRLREEHAKREGRERKERLLNEIIEWALDIAKCSFSLDSANYSGVTDFAEAWAFARAGIAGENAALAQTIVTGQYISKIALVFSKDLQKRIEQLREELTKHHKLTEKVEDYLTNKVPADKSVLGEGVIFMDNAIAHLPRLLMCTNKVIEESTKIKARDIG